jgi:predicted site-specific integrase-resolvase
MTTIAPDKETASIEEASQRLGISRSLGYALAREGRFPVPVIRAGTRLLVPLMPLERLLAGEEGGKAAA